MKKENDLIEIKLNNYNIYLKNGIFQDAPSYLKRYQQEKKLFLITDDKVYLTYQDLINEVFDGYEKEIIVIENGEKSKTFDSYLFIVNELFKRGFKKYHTLIAFGGGVVGDLAGFVASTLYRGISYIQIPTTLLAQVDSSIGGKTGVDTMHGKNLVGAFYEPKAVLIDPKLLKTLERRDFNNGMAEVIKAGLIHNDKLFEMVKNEENLETIIKEAILVKKHFVDLDPFDKKERRILNFGHTYGHALEAALNYDFLLHGEAISIGMLKAINLGVKIGLTPPEVYNDVLNVLNKYELIKKHPDVSNEDILNKITFDKKFELNGIDYILLTNIGKAVIKRLTITKDDWK